MTTQPEVLWLADALDELDKQFSQPGLCGEGAAKLRGLHEENNRLVQINFAHEIKLSVRGYEIQIADLKAQREGMLEALKELTSAVSLFAAFGHEWPEHINAMAAIKKAEGSRSASGYRAEG
jgi:hypothetical protein